MPAQATRRPGRWAMPPPIAESGIARTMETMPKPKRSPKESVDLGERAPRAVTICCSASCRRKRRSTAPSIRWSTFSRNESTSADSYSSPSSLRACRVALSSFLSSGSRSSIGVMEPTVGRLNLRCTGVSPPVARGSFLRQPVLLRVCVRHVLRILLVVVDLAVELGERGGRQDVAEAGERLADRVVGLAVGDAGDDVLAGDQVLRVG